MKYRTYFLGKVLQAFIICLSNSFLFDSGGFIGEYVAIGRPAKIRTKAAVPGHSFEHQCRHCEKVLILTHLSVNVCFFSFHCIGSYPIKKSYFLIKYMYHHLVDDSSGLCV